MKNVVNSIIPFSTRRNGYFINFQIERIDRSLVTLLKTRY